MKLLDVLTAPWAIEPAKLLEIQTIYATHLRGEKIDIAAVEARLGRPLDNTPAAYTVVDGVAVLQVNGVMAKRANLFMDISGGTSMQLAARALQQAAEDTQVHSIIQVFDTPGGTVDGTQSFANAIARVNAIKSVITLADGTMASAGVWAGSAGRQVYLADATTAVGSIGVVSQHVDLSGRDAQAGIKRTEVFAGKYKRIASDTGPLSAEGLQSMQDQVDYIYSLFVQAVATHRGTTIDQVLANMADGRMFTGQQVIAAGLADGIATLDELIVQLNQDRSRSPATGRPGGHATARAPIAATPPRTTTMTPEQLAIDHPEAVASIRTDAASAERARIQAVEAQAIPGHDALIASLKFDGKSTAGDAAMAVLAAEKTARTNHAKALAADAPAPLALVPAKTVESVSAQPKTRAEQDGAAKAYMAAHPGTDYLAAFKQIQGA
jgi:signal peptide peptidase SppA